MTSPREGIPVITGDELSVAAEIQRLLLPKRVPKVEGLELDAYYNPSSALGGDYYDLIDLDREHLGFVVADVSGKGLPAALVMVQVRTLVRAEARRTRSPRDILVQLNRGLSAEMPGGMFVTVFFAVLNLPRSELLVCNAGHNPMLYLRRGRGCGWVTNQGMAVGVDRRGTKFEASLREERIRFGAGDRFLMYTDGVTEAANLRGELYGPERLRAGLAAFGHTNSAQFISTLLADLKRFRGGASQSDDITILAARRLERPAGLRLVSSEKYVACRLCDEVVGRGEQTCPSCRTDLEPTGRITLQVRENEVECLCGEIYEVRRGTNGCPACGLGLCAQCRRGPCAAGPLCASCVDGLSVDL